MTLADLRRLAEEEQQRQLREANDRAERELEKARDLRDRATKAEQDRLAQEREAEHRARIAREADEAHRVQVRNAIATALARVEAPNMLTLAELLMSGAVPHVKVEL